MIYSSFNGMPIMENPLLTVKVPARRHRKKRINKKWLKKYGYKEKPSLHVYTTVNPITGQRTIVGHPTTIKRLIQLANK